MLSGGSSRPKAARAIVLSNPISGPAKKTQEIVVRMPGTISRTRQRTVMRPRNGISVRTTSHASELPRTNAITVTPAVNTAVFHSAS